MGDMGAMVTLQQAERLVSSIARAFYTDTVILVVDTLIREKYIKDKDEELGSRLNLQPKQIRSALADLQQEGLVAQEEMSDEQYSSRSSSYWYIDLRHAVNVIRLRVHTMQAMLNERHQAKMASQTYVCPRCHEKFGVMDIIQRLRNGAGSFCCSHCCNNDDHQDCGKSEYTLVDFHDRRGLEFVNSLIALLNEQLGKSTDPSIPRQSVYELVNVLRDTVVPSNLPSELRARGMGGQQRRDVSSAHARFEDDFHHRGRAADKAAVENNSRTRHSNKAVQLLYTKNWRGQDVVVEIERSEDEDEDWGDNSGDSDGGDGPGGTRGLGGILPSRQSIKRKAASAAAREEQAAKRAKKSLPSYLKGSKISGGATEEGTNSEAIDDDAEENGLDDKSSTGQGTTHARRLGAIVVNSLEERDEFKKRLLPWRDKMRDVLIRQEGEDEAREAWWEEDEQDELANGGAVNGHMNGKTPSGNISKGEKFLVAGRSVSMEELTPDDAANMSPEEYVRFYNLSSSQ